MKNVLYITDLDGTLLNSSAQLSEYSQNKLCELIASGVQFTVASLRSAVSIATLFQHVPLKLPVIEMNGAFVTDCKQNKKLISSTMDTHTKQEILQMILQHGLCPIMQCYSRERDLLFFGEKPNSATSWYRSELKYIGDVRVQHKMQFADCYSMDWVSITVVDTHAKLASLKEQIDTTFTQTHTSITESAQTPGFDWFTVNAPGANKGQGLTALKQHLGYQSYYTVAFGDQPIDIPMLEAAQEAVAPENAHPTVLAATQTHIGSNDTDAVVDFINWHYTRFEA